jgi:hypothetical protein
LQLHRWIEVDVNSSDDNRSIQRQYVAIVGVFFVVGAVLSFIIASYLSRGSIQYFFSFNGSDGPSGYPDSVNPRSLGVHYFGDYLLPRWQGQLKSPWFITDPAQGPITNYLPFTMAVFWFFGLFSYWPSFAIYLLIPLVTLMAIIWKSLSLDSVSERIQFMVMAVVLTGPFISLTDRGNIQIFLITFSAIAVFLFCKKRFTSGAIALGLAIALKGYPIFLIVLWIKAKRWRDVIICITTTAVCTVVPLFFYQGGVLTNLSRILRNVRLNEQLYVADSLAYNNSLRATLRTLTQFHFLEIDRLSQTAYDNFGIVFLLLFTICIFLMLSRHTDRLETVMLAVVLMSTYVNFVAGYALSVFFLFIIALQRNQPKMRIGSMRLLMILIAVQMTPKGFPLKFWSQEPSGPVATYSSLLGGTASLLIVLIIAIEHIHRRRAASITELQPA